MDFEVSTPAMMAKNTRTTGAMDRQSNVRPFGQMYAGFNLIKKEIRVSVTEPSRHLFIGLTAIDVMNHK
jgi:hypothetical protein